MPEVFVGCCAVPEALPGVDGGVELEVGAIALKRLLGSFCGRNFWGVW